MAEFNFSHNYYKNYQVIADSINSLSFIKSGLLDGTSYSFKVRAINEKGFSDYSEEFWIATNQIDTIGEIKFYMTASLSKKVL